LNGLSEDERHAYYDITLRSILRAFLWVNAVYKQDILRGVMKKLFMFVLFIFGLWLVCFVFARLLQMQFYIESMQVYPLY